MKDSTKIVSNDVKTVVEKVKSRLAFENIYK